MNQAETRRGSIAVGVVLIVLGAAVLLGRSIDLDVGWPIWVIAPGVIIFVLAFVVGGPGGAGFASVGAMVTAVGCILAVQQATGTYASWAYAWALVAPGAVGLGLLVYGLWRRDGDMARGGLGALATGLVIFLIGFAFFEGVLGLDDLGGPVADLIVPAAIVAVGVGFIVIAFLPRRRHRGQWAATAAPGGAWAGSATPGAAAGARPPAGGRVETLDVPLDPATGEAAVQIAFGAGRLEIGPAKPGRLVDGEYDGGVVAQSLGPNHVRLAPPQGWDWHFDRVPFDWLVGLAGEVPVRVSLEVGAADVTADLEALRVPDLRVKTGAASLRITLPRAGVTRVDAEGGAASLAFRVPAGVAGRIRTSMALGSVTVDEARFPKVSSGMWASAGADTATDRVEFDVRGGIGSVTIG